MATRAIYVWPPGQSTENIKVGVMVTTRRAKSTNKRILADGDVIIPELEDIPQENVTVKDVIHRGDDTFPADVVISALENAGLVFIYDTVTGERSISPRNIEVLREVLRRTREDGTRVFTLVKSDKEPWRGTIKCLLHSDDINRKHYDELGLPTCHKSNIPSPYMLTLHMQHRHPTAWATINAEKVEAERLEERELRRAMLGRPAETTREK